MIAPCMLARASMRLEHNSRRLRFSSDADIVRLTNARIINTLDLTINLTNVY